MKISKSVGIISAILMLVFTFKIAGATTNWNDDQIFNGTVNWFKKGVKIGQQGSGGVTFFNGTIVNSTTTSGADNPVTFGDNVRIDGEIWRGPNAGPGDDKPVKINDDLKVEGSIQGYYTQSQIEQNYYTQSQIEDDYYSKTEADSRFISVGEAIQGYYTANQIDQNFYTKTEADERFVSYDSPEWATRYNYLSISPTNCKTTDSTKEYISYYYAAYPIPGTLVMMCPLTLPDNSTLTSFEALLDDTVAGLVMATLYRTPFNTEAPTLISMANATSSGTGGPQIVLSSVRDEVVDNYNNTYFIAITYSLASASLNFRGARIGYSFTQPY